MDGVEDGGFAWWCNGDDALVVEVIYFIVGLKSIIIIIEYVEFMTILIYYLLELVDQCIFDINNLILHTSDPFP